MISKRQRQRQRRRVIAASSSLGDDSSSGASTIVQKACQAAADGPRGCERGQSPGEGGEPPIHAKKHRCGAVFWPDQAAFIDARVTEANPSEECQFRHARLVQHLQTRIEEALAASRYYQTTAAQAVWVSEQAARGMRELRHAPLVTPPSRQETPQLQT